MGMQYLRKVSSQLSLHKETMQDTKLHAIDLLMQF